MTPRKHALTTCTPLRTWQLTPLLTKQHVHKTSHSESVYTSVSLRFHFRVPCLASVYPSWLESTQVVASADGRQVRTGLLRATRLSFSSGRFCDFCFKVWKYFTNPRFSAIHSSYVYERQERRWGKREPHRDWLDNGGRGSENTLTWPVVP